MAIPASIVKASSVKTTCYGSNDAVVAGALPCNPLAEVSTCCGFTETCYNNGLCAPGPGLPSWGPSPYYTGYCTDISWSNGTACPSICNNERGAGIGGNGVQMCGGNAYCCYNTSSAQCCETSSLVFSLAAITSSTALPYSALSVGVTISSLSASTDVTTTTSSFSASTNATTANSSSSALVDATTTNSTLSASKDSTTTTQSSVVSSSPTLPTILPIISPSTNSPTSHTPSDPFGAGIGAGIGIAAALILVIGFTFNNIRQRRMRNHKPHMRPNPAQRGIKRVRTIPIIHEMDGQKHMLVEPDGQDIVEIDDTRIKTFF